MTEPWWDRGCLQDKQEWPCTGCGKSHRKGEGCFATAPDSPPQIVSAPVTDYEVGEFLAQNCNFPVPHWAEGFDAFKKLLTQLRVASSSNAALLDKIQKLRFNLYHYAPFDGQSHTTACSIWREDGQGHAEGFDGSMGPCNCGALINYWRIREEAAESKVQDEQKAHETIAHYLIALVGTADGTSVSAAERAAAEIEDLRSEVDGLREALRGIADFAVGHGDVCEIIARRAREALRLGTESAEEPK